MVQVAQKKLEDLVFRQLCIKRSAAAAGGGAGFTVSLPLRSLSSRPDAIATGNVRNAQCRLFDHSAAALEPPWALHAVGAGSPASLPICYRRGFTPPAGGEYAPLLPWPVYLLLCLSLDAYRRTGRVRAPSFRHSAFSSAELNQAIRRLMLHCRQSLSRLA